MKYYKINDKKIVLNGIGKRFYQDGIPISISIEDCHNNDINVSMFHVADELLKQGWKPKTVLNKLEEEKTLDINNVMDMTNIKEFCFADYDTQREMIYISLFGNEDKQKSLAKLIN